MWCASKELCDVSGNYLDHNVLMWCNLWYMWTYFKPFISLNIYTPYDIFGELVPSWLHTIVDGLLFERFRLISMLSYRKLSSVYRTVQTPHLHIFFLIKYKQFHPHIFFHFAKPLHPFCILCFFCALRDWVLLEIWHLISMYDIPFFWPCMYTPCLNSYDVFVVHDTYVLLVLKSAS